ncbi:MAG: VOC family protein [Cyclobacteriaceae bacterium]|nr:VOC family protein [Cyclobacteriaceae bacterium SS2]
MADQDFFSESALTTILVVKDIKRSKDFYIKVLGASVFREYGGDSVVLNFLNNWILLVTPGGPTEDKPDINFEPPQDPGSVSHSFTIRVIDCEEAYKVLKRRGAKFVTPPVSRGLETRCFFRDPDGHLFEISEHR